MLPELTPLLVVGDHDVEALMRSARADLAKLSLELRAVQHEAASAQSAWVTDAPTIDLDAATELLRTGVEARIARRRIERRAEIERAQRDAARRITDAEAEARALVDAARAQLLWALHGTTSPPTPAARRPVPPAAPTPTIGPDDDPMPDSQWMPTATDDGDWILVTEVVPPPAPPSPLPTSAPLSLRPPAAPSAADDANWRLVTEAVPAASPHSPPRPVSLAPPAANAEAAPVFAAPPVTAQPASGPGPSRRSFRWQGLLHADVLLPLIAVLIVAVVLLAWAA